MKSTKATQLLPVSVVVACRNEEENLKKLIPAVLRQSYSNFELVLVDDRSTDKTSEIISSFDDSRIRVVKIIDEQKDWNPKKYAITRGIELAKNPIILLTDADCIPVSEHWIEDMAGNFSEETDIVLGLSFYKKKKGFLNRFIRFETIITALQYVSSTLLRNPYMGVGRNMGFRKSYFIKKGGYKEFYSQTGGDDDLFVNKYGTPSNTKISLKSSTITLSEPKETIGEYFIQKKRHLSVGKKYTLLKLLWVGSFAFFNVLFVVSGLILAIIINEPLLFIMGLCIKWLFLGSILNTFLRRVGVDFEILLLPVLDLVFFVYYIVVGLNALFSEKIKWA